MRSIVNWFENTFIYPLEDGGTFFITKAETGELVTGLSDLEILDHIVAGYRYERKPLPDGTYVSFSDDVENGITYIVIPPCNWFVTMMRKLLGTYIYESMSQQEYLARLAQFDAESSDEDII